MKHYLVKTLLLTSLCLISACGVKGPLESPSAKSKKQPVAEAPAKSSIEQAEDAAKNTKEMK